jgi:hypothetical protein
MMVGGSFGLDHKTSMQLAAGFVAGFGAIQLVIGTVIAGFTPTPFVNREDDPNWFWLGIAMWMGVAALIYLNAA